jgi:succinyl-diaminopimelate desuccinylase
MTPVLELSQQLINIKSITPNDPACQQLLSDRLASQHYKITQLPGDLTQNFWAEQPGDKPLLVFSGHTDTVPAGDLGLWTSPPFTATIREKRLFGRGTADMKCAIAAMMVAQESFFKDNPEAHFRLGFMITSDEEGDATEGTVKLVEHTLKNNIKINWCLIGEATSINQLGDHVKIGRRGSLHGELFLKGKQGHIAYPQLADNPIHRCFKALDELTETTWDSGNDLFSPTSFQIYNIHADTGATNMIPGSLSASFNFRFAPPSTAESLKKEVLQKLDQYNLDYRIEWKLMSTPFFSKSGALLNACKTAINHQQGISTIPNTAGGTSDGRFITKTGCEIVELGPINKSIHQVNENILLEDLEQLTNIYYHVLMDLNKQLESNKERICNTG